MHYFLVLCCSKGKTRFFWQLSYLNSKTYLFKGSQINTHGHRDEQFILARWQRFYVWQCRTDHIWFYRHDDNFWTVHYCFIFKNCCGTQTLKLEKLLLIYKSCMMCLISDNNTLINNAEPAKTGKIEESMWCMSIRMQADALVSTRKEEEYQVTLNCRCWVTAYRSTNWVIEGLCWVLLNLVSFITFNQSISNNEVYYKIFDFEFF